jgi:hypothetical protein
MWQLLSRCAWKLGVRSYRRKIRQALALYGRSEVRRDGLAADHVCSRLEIRWRARDIHPWDRHCTRDEREALFIEQALADTEAAVLRLFERLPHIDVIELGVLEPTSEVLIVSGTVHRPAPNATRPPLLSVGMRLRELGITYRFAARDRRASNAHDVAGEFCVR